MPNPDGKNSNADLRPYGDVKKQTQLMRAAPMSGAPFAGSAVNSARRAQRQAVAGASGKPAAASLPPQGSAPLPATQPADTGQQQTVQRAAIWADLAATPGASPLVQAYAAQAQQEASP